MHSVFCNEIMCTLTSCSFDDVNAGIGIGIAVADSIVYRVPTWYRSNTNEERRQREQMFTKECQTFPHTFPPCVKSAQLHKFMIWLSYCHKVIIIITRRPASADRIVRRQFQATGQPVSQTQASDTMMSWLPRSEAKCVQRRCFQCELVPLRSDIKGTELPLLISWYHSKGNWLRYNFAAESFYIMKLCSRLFFLYCRNCPKDDKCR